MSKLREFKQELNKLIQNLTCRVTVTESSIIADPQDAYQLAHLKNKEFFEHLRKVEKDEQAT